eukprot:956727_1
MHAHSQKLHVRKYMLIANPLFFRYGCKYIDTIPYERRNWLRTTVHVLMCVLLPVSVHKTFKCQSNFTHCQHKSTPCYVSFFLVVIMSPFLYVCIDFMIVSN